MARRNEIDAESEAQQAREALQRLTDENALLRAALADARSQLGQAMPPCAMSRAC